MIKGDVLVGQVVGAIWGKSKKLYSCKVITLPDINEVSPEIPVQAATRTSAGKQSRVNSEKPFTFEVASPPSFRETVREESDFVSDQDSITSTCNEVRRKPDGLAIEDIAEVLRQSGLSDIKQYFDDLADSISGLKAKIAVLEQTLLTRLPEPSPTLVEDGPLTSTLVQPEADAEATILREIGNLTSDRSSARAVCDTGLSGSVSSEGQKVSVAHTILRQCMNGCKSRRNLAGRLTQTLFTENEKRISNVRGVAGKVALDVWKVEAIQEACYQQFPADRTESKIATDRELRNAMDEICRKSRSK